MIDVIQFLLGAVAVCGAVWLGAQLLRARHALRQMSEECDAARHRLQQLECQLGALCNASAGAGEHVIRLENQVRRIVERQNQLEMRAGSERPYQQASQLVHKGANIDELVDTCGLTRGEAELLVMMQRGAA